MSFVSQVLHVFRKDLRKFWPYLVGLVGLGWLELGLDLDQVGRSAAGVVIPLPSLFPLGCAALAAWVVLEDKPAADDAFWFTKPLGSHVMLVAKSAFVLLFLVLVPIAAEVFWLQQFGPVDQWSITLDGLVMHGGLMAIVFLLAAVSPSFKAFVTLGAAGWLSLSLLGALFPSQFGGVWDLGPDLTRTYLIRLGWLTLGTCLVTYQYLSRRTVVVAAVAAVGLGCAQIARPQIEVDLSRGGTSLVSTDTPLPADSLDIGLGTLRHRAMLVRDYEEANAIPVIEGDLRFTLPAGWYATLREARVTLLGGSNPWDREVRPGGDPYFRLWNNITDSLLDGSRVLVRPGINAGATIPLVWGDWSEQGRRVPDATHVRLTATLDLHRIQIVGRLPLVPGAKLQSRLGHIQIEAVDNAPDLITVRLSASEPQAFLMDFAGSGLFEVILHNRVRREILQSQTGGTGGVVGSKGLVGGGRLVKQLHEARFYGEPGIGSPLSAPLPPSWFEEDLELLIVTAATAGTLEKESVTRIDEWPTFGDIVWAAQPPVVPGA